MKRLIHECAYVIAQRVLWVLEGVLRDEAKRDGFLEAYLAIKEELEQYEATAEKEATSRKMEGNHRGQAQ